MSKLLRPYILIATGLLIITGVIAVLPVKVWVQGNVPEYEITWLGDTFLGDRAHEILEK